MSGWILWVIGACAFGVGEMLTSSFFLAPFALGALIAAGVDAAGLSGSGSLAIFIAVSLVTLLVLRPIALSHMRSAPALRTGAAAIVGKDALVLERICNSEGVGCVKIDGEIWTARSYDEDEVIEPGQRVQVLGIKGATALVSE
jgi:membrane protein implicated in regulation of membrane protease activity